MKSQGYNLMVSLDVIDKIVADSDKMYGARDIQRNIVKNVEEPVCDALITSTVDYKNIKVTSDGVSIYEIS